MMTPKRRWTHSLARASKKAMPRLWRYWKAAGWAEFGEGTSNPYFEGKHRAKLGARNKKRIFGMNPDDA
jgi:hypothetical protein